MANNSVTNEPSVQPSTPFVSDRIFPGAGKGPNTIHKVGSAKQYATKGVGRVCNQSKFPTLDRKGPARKRD
jgi:hypothetical protein